MTIARQRSGNTRSHCNEQTQKSIARQWLAKHTFPRQRIKQELIHRLLEMMICIRFAWKLVQFRRVQSQGILHSAFVREFSVQSWSVNQGIMEAEEVIDS
jgi:hypothetical protein